MEENLEIEDIKETIQRFEDKLKWFKRRLKNPFHSRTGKPLSEKTLQNYKKQADNFKKLAEKWQEMMERQG